MTPEELDNTTPRQFHNRLNGWRQLRDYDWEDRWRQTRQIVAWQAKAIPWKNGHEPDLMRLMPLPGDPPLQHTAKEPDPEAIRAMFRGAKDVWGMKLTDRLEKFVGGSESTEPPPNS